MNALQLADQLQAEWNGDGFQPDTSRNAAAMLRKQDAEIREWRNVFGFLGTPDELGNEWNALKETNSRQDAAIKQLREALIECVDDSRQVVFDYEVKYGEHFKPKRLAAMRKTVADAEAALAATEKL